MMQASHDKAKQTWILLLASLASFMVSLDSVVVATALSTIHRDFGGSIEALEWTVNAYNLSFAVLLILGAALGDRFGRRRMFIAGLVLFSLASAACALAQNIGWLVAARTIQGGGAALVAPLALTQLSVAFPAEARGRAMGIFGGVAGLAVLAGPVVGGAITQGLAWQWIFWLNVPIGALVIVGVLARTQESFGPRTGLDIIGLLLVSGSGLGLLWGLVRGNSVGWGSFEVVVTLATGFLVAVAFVLWERRTRTPMVPMRFFRSRVFSAGNTANFLFQASMIGTVFFLAQFLQSALGYGPLGAGLRLLPLTATLFVTAPIAGTLFNRVGERPLMVVGLLMQAIGIAWIGWIATPRLAYAELIAPLILLGIGASMVLPATQNVVMSSMVANEIGKVSGVFSMLGKLGGAFGVALVTAVFASVGSFGSAQAFSNGVAPALEVSGLLALLGMFAALFLPGRRAGSVVQPQSEESEKIQSQASSALS